LAVAVFIIIKYIAYTVSKFSDVAQCINRSLLLIKRLLTVEIAYVVVNIKPLPFTCSEFKL